MKTDRLSGNRRMRVILLLVGLMILTLSGAAWGEADEEQADPFGNVPGYASIRFVIPQPDGAEDVIERLIDAGPDACVGVLPEDPFVPGMTFLGWTDAETQAEITAETAVDRELTAVAQFAPIEVYTVTVQYGYRRNETEFTQFDRAVLTVCADRITEDQPLTVPSPVRAEMHTSSVPEGSLPK